MSGLFLDCPSGKEPETVSVEGKCLMQALQSLPASCGGTVTYRRSCKQRGLLMQMGRRVSATAAPETGCSVLKLEMHALQSLWGTFGSTVTFRFSRVRLEMFWAGVGC
jgi:hypothetical protein